MLDASFADIACNQLLRRKRSFFPHGSAPQIRGLAQLPVLNEPLEIPVQGEMLPTTEGFHPAIGLGHVLGWRCVHRLAGDQLVEDRLGALQRHVEAVDRLVAGGGAAGDGELDEIDETVPLTLLIRDERKVPLAGLQLLDRALVLKAFPDLARQVWMCGSASG